MGIWNYLFKFANPKQVLRKNHRLTYKYSNKPSNGLFGKNNKLYSGSFSGIFTPIQYSESMVKHVLLFKLRDMSTPAEKMEVMQEIKRRLEGLKETVPAIETIEVGINANPKEEFDIALVSTHADWDALAAYRDDPNHVEVARFIGQYREARSCADFEF